MIDKDRIRKKKHLDDWTSLKLSFSSLLIPLMPLYLPKIFLLIKTNILSTIISLFSTLTTPQILTSSNKQEVQPSTINDFL